MNILLNKKKVIMNNINNYTDTMPLEISTT